MNAPTTRRLLLAVALLRTPPAQKWAEHIEELDGTAKASERNARILAAFRLRRLAASERRLATSQRGIAARMRTCPKRPDPTGERPQPWWVRLPLDVWCDTWPWVVAALVVSLLSEHDQWAFAALAALVTFSVVTAAHRAIRLGVRS